MSSQEFVQIAAAMKTVVDDHGGVVVVKQEDVRDILREVDPNISKCSKMRLQRFRLCLRRQELSSRAYKGHDPRTLMIFDTDVFDEESARRFHEEVQDGSVLPPAEQLVSA